ncbi:hypothetical protein [Amycolatopsis sp. YIM 10]|uniref:hypothetical protein n=1 Tax=Amycolatopsis sp. YIM 10 TaxID=2653857 RepID=UPI001883301F|nr:hypothetical protein [Amycolatopsis sp. YIM 10]
MPFAVADRFGDQRHVDPGESRSCAGDGVPTWGSLIRIETSELKGEVVVPPSQTRRLLDTAVTALVAFGAPAGPALTFKVVPDTWATAGTAIGQLVVLAPLAHYLSTTCRLAVRSLWWGDYRWFAH